VNFIDVILSYLEHYFWPRLEEVLEGYLDAREGFYEVLKAQDEGFEVIFEDI
jgi:hypothetical protein